SKNGYTTTHKTSAKTAKISRPAPPSRTGPNSWGECPSYAPIKGNASSMIYHVPGGSYYDRTNPEECFSTRAAAERAGYRASKR
ncbi:MAG: sunset domain-containing protein, partial [Mycetocola reblochoni]